MVAEAHYYFFLLLLMLHFKDTENTVLPKNSYSTKMGIYFPGDEVSKIARRNEKKDGKRRLNESIVLLDKNGHF